MRVLIVDDHEVVRRGVRSLLSANQGVEVCGEAVDGRDAIVKAQELKPDVITMDISMPNLNGLEATREIRRLLPQTQILILSQHDVPEMMRQALNAGASGYVVKSAISTDLVAALEQLRQGHRSFGEAVFGSTQLNIDTEEILQRSAAFEKALRDSEERLRQSLDYTLAVLNNMAEGLYTVDANGLLTSINPAAESMFGWNKDELLGKKMHELTHYKHPDGAPFPASDCPGLHVLQKGIALREHEDTFVRKDGSFLPVIFSASPLIQNGIVSGVIVGFRDDTEQRRDRDERKRAEEALSAAARQQEALFHFADHLHRAKSLDDVYTATFDAIFSALRCDRASILLYDNTSVMRFVSWRGLSDKYRKATDGHSPWKPDEKNPQPLCITDVQAAELDPHLKEIVLGEGIRALAFIPLVSAGKLIGKFMVYYNAPHIFTEQELELSLTIAHQLAFGIERRRADRALRESEERFRAIVETTPSCVKLVSPDGTLLHMNSSGLAMIGASSLQQVVGHSVFDLIAPEDRQRFRDFHATICAGERGALSFDIIGLRGVRRHMDTHAVPLWNPDGSVAHLAVTRDVTERKQMEEALRESQSNLALALEAANTALFEWDMLTSRGRWNPQMAAIYGFTPPDDEIDAQGWTQLFHPDDTARLMCEAEVTFREKDNFLFEFRTIRPDGELRWIVSKGRVIRDAQGKPLRLIGTHSDITDRKHRELGEITGRILKSQDEERRRIARELHDDVGQLLAAIAMNIATVAREKDALSSAAARCVEENSLMIEQVSAEIRTLSHLLHPPLLDEIGLKSALQWYIDGFAERSKIDVKLDLPESLGRLPEDRELSLFRIVQESLTNIHRHSGSSTAVVRLSQTPRSVTLEVKDNGKGISRELRARISAGEDSGVGLRGMRERVRQLGGSLEIHSNGTGTSIVVDLPVPESAAESHAEMSSGNGAGTSSPTKAAAGSAPAETLKALDRRGQQLG